MWIGMVIGVVLVLIGVWRVFVWSHIIMKRPLHCWLTVLRGVAEVSAWMTAGAVIILSVLPSITYLWLNGLLLTCTTSVGLAWATGRILRAATVSGVRQVRDLLKHWIENTFVRSVQGLKQAATILAPAGPKDIRLDPDLLDHLLAPRTFVLSYLLSLALVPVLMALLFIWTIRGGSVALGAFFAAVVGYNALAVVSCLTVATLALYVLLAFVHDAGGLLFPLHLRAALRTVATWTGYGTAAGFVAAALLPAMSRALPMPSVSGDQTADLAQVLSPQILMDVPATSAVIGYGLGLILSTIVVCRGAANLLVRRFLAPSLFIAMIAALGHAGLNPQSIVQYIATAMPTEDCSAGVDLKPRIQDAGWLLRHMSSCGEPIFLKTAAFVIGTAVTTFLCAGAKLLVDFRRCARDTATHNMSQGRFSTQKRPSGGGQALTDTTCRDSSQGWTRRGSNEATGSGSRG